LLKKERYGPRYWAETAEDRGIGLNEGEPSEPFPKGRYGVVLCLIFGAGECHGKEQGGKIQVGQMKKNQKKRGGTSVGMGPAT